MHSWVHSLFWRWRARRFRRAPRLPVILLYHSVSPRERDPLQLGVDPGRFDRQLAWLAARTCVIPLADFVHRHDDGSLPANAVAITFNHGYADNLTIAEEALRRRAMPATIFLTSDYINSPEEGWWEELEAIFLGAPVLPSRFEFEGVGFPVEPRADPARAVWTVGERPISLRERAFLRAVEFARGLRRSHRRRFLHALRAWGQRDEHARPGREFASWGMLRSASRRGTFSFGAHTRSHPALSTLAFAEQAAEIHGCCTSVRTHLGTEPAGFAYPFGSYRDFSPATIAAVRTSGCGFACASMPAHCIGSHSRWQLPRLAVRNWEVAEFAARLGG